MMMNRKITEILVTLAVFFAFASGYCQAAAEETLRIALSSSTRPLDPATATTSEQAVAALPTYETLVRRSRKGEAGSFVPERASLWRFSEEELTWTFEIAPGGSFESGAPVDAAAVKFSLDRLIAIGRGPASLAKDAIDTVEITAPMTLKIKLRHPTPRFLAILADRATSIVDPDIMKHSKEGDWAAGWLASHTAGSGPYALRKRGAADAYVLERNPHYARPPFFDKIIFRETPDPISRALSVARNEADIAVMMPVQALRRVNKNQQLRVVSTPTWAFQNVAFNLQKPDFSDIRLRRAAAMAIDVEAIIKYIREGRASIFRGPLPEGSEGADPLFYPVHYDLDAAKTLAKEVLGDEEIIVRMIYPGVSPETDTVAQYLQAQFAEIGVKVRLERLSIAAYVDRINRGSYDLVLMGFVAKDDDPLAILDFWFNSESVPLDNPARYEDPTIDRLRGQLRTVSDPVTRAGILKEIAVIVNAELPYIYLQQTHISVLIRDDLEGLEFDPIAALDIPYEIMWRRQ